MRRRDGFTLIELVVVLLLIAVATAVTVPALLAEPEQADMDFAQQRVQLLFRLARDSSVAGGTPVTVSLDSVTGNAWLVTGTALNEADEASNNLAGAGMVRVTPGEELGLPPSVTMQLTSARARFRFLPGGAAFGDTITLQSRGAARSLTVNPWTGDVLVY